MRNNLQGDAVYRRARPATGQRHGSRRAAQRSPTRLPCCLSAGPSADAGFRPPKRVVAGGLLSWPERTSRLGGGRGMDEPIVVALADSLRGADGDRVAAVSPRVRVAYVSPGGEPHDDVTDAQVIYRGFGLMP